MTIDLSGKCAVVTGARRGIGAAIARALLDHGAGVVICGRNAEQVQAQAGELDAAFPGRARGYAGDLLAADARTELVTTTPRIDILVNNAGGFTRTVDTLGCREDEWNEQLAANLTMPFLLCQAVLPQMIERRWGRIVNIGSIVAAAPQQDNAIGYVAAKSGLVGFTRQLAVEVAPHGVTANVVNPGTVLTEHLEDYLAASDTASEDVLAARIPVGRLARPHEIAGVVPYLASEAGAFITGAVVDVNGGAVHA